MLSCAFHSKQRIGAWTLLLLLLDGASLFKALRNQLRHLTSYNFSRSLQLVHIGELG